MKINILHLTEGAKKAKGITVVIDVFRAFSVQAYMFSMGVERIIPTASEEHARQLKKDNPNFILAGERHGRILEGFDTGNSPSLLHLLELNGKTVIHTTSAGTQGISNAKAADEILGAGLVNVKATAEYIRKSKAEIVSLVCMGWEGKEKTDEDTLCAEYIKALLENRKFDIAAGIENLRYTSGAKFFDKAQNTVFPEQDFFMCTDVDRFDFVIRFEQVNDGLGFMKRLNTK